MSDHNIAVFAMFFTVLSAVLGTSWKLSTILSTMQQQMLHVLDRVVRLEAKHDLTTEDRRALAVKLAQIESDIEDLKRVVYEGDS